MGASACMAAFAPRVDCHAFLLTCLSFVGARTAVVMSDVRVP